MSFENPPVDRGSSEKRKTIFKSDSLPVSWLNEGVKVYVEINKVNGEFYVGAHEEGLSPDEDWLNYAPTTRRFKDETEARDWAVQMIDDRENWLSSVYN